MTSAFQIMIPPLIEISFTAVGIFVLLIIYTRILGLRSFSKMSSFDFAMTIAVGSLLATTIISKSTSLLAGAIAIGSLFVIQGSLSFLRKCTNWFSKVVDNEPLLLMRDGVIFYDALKISRVTENDLIAKLREANVLRFSQVRAVVLETTGDISVLHTNNDTDLEDRILQSVRHSK